MTIPPAKPRQRLGFFTRLLDQAPLRRVPAGASVEEAIALLNIHTGVPEEVIASLQADSALARGEM